MDGHRSRRRVALRMVGLAGILAGSVLLAAGCATRPEGRTQPPDGFYPNVTVEGRTVPMIHVKDHGATVLVDTVGKEPRVWAEQFRRHGDLPDGTFNIHKTHLEGHENFADVPVDRRGIWVIDASGTITAMSSTSVPPDGPYPNATVEGRKVAMVWVKDNGATVLVDLEGKEPRVWAEQFRRRGDVPNGVYDIHKTHVTGHEDFRDLPVDRKGLWTIDASGNVTAR